MEENFHSICERMQSERDTLKRKLEEERKVILERAKLSEVPDKVQFQTAQLLWYDNELKRAEKIKLRLQQDLEVAKSSKNTSTDTDEYLRLRKENQLLKVRITNLTAKFEDEKGSLNLEVKNLTKELETVTSKAEELVKRNTAPDEFFRMAPASKRKPLTPSLTQAPDQKRQKATEASLVSDKPDAESKAHLDLAAQASAPVLEKAELEAKAAPAPAPKWGDEETH